MRIISRSEWGSQYGNYSGNSTLSKPLNEWVVHTEAAVYKGTDLKSDMIRVRGIERFHVQDRDFLGGIGYSFLISPTGNIFEGRGWLKRGAHTQEGRNSTAHAVCFLGHGDIDHATAAQWASAKWLMGEGIRLGNVRPNYVVSGHRNYTAKTCPGNLIYPHIGQLRGITSPVQPVPTPTPVPPIVVPDPVFFPEEDAMFLRPLAVLNVVGTGTLKHAYIFYYPEDASAKFIARSCPGGAAQANHIADEMGFKHPSTKPTCGTDWFPLTDFLDGPLKNVGVTP